MSTPYQRIENYDQVLGAFGYWPSFHDAEVLSLRLDHDQVVSGPIHEVCIDVSLHAFEWTAHVPASFNHHLVRFRFRGVEDLAIEGFNHQNAILEFKVEERAVPPDAPAGFRVTFVPAYGLSGSFLAGSAEVLSVIPCDEQGRPRQKAEPEAPPNSRPPSQLPTSPEDPTPDSRSAKV